MNKLFFKSRPQFFNVFRVNSFSLGILSGLFRDADRPFEECCPHSTRAGRAASWLPQIDFASKNKPDCGENERKLSFLKILNAAFKKRSQKLWSERTIS